MKAYKDPQYEINKKFTKLEKNKYNKQDRLYNITERFYGHGNFEVDEIEDLKDYIEYLYEHLY